MPEKQKVKRKLSAILSADVKGYSLLMADDEIHTIETLTSYRQIISDHIQDYSGRVVDSPGDNILAEFRSVVDALQCAVEIQKQLKLENDRFAEDKKVQFRIGVNIGDVIQEGDRIYGHGVNVAARIEGLAEPGGVCISRNAYTHIRDKLKLGYEYLGEHSVKNIKRPVRVYKVLLDPEDAGKLIGVKTKPSVKKWAWRIAAAVVALLGIVAWQVYEKLTAPEFEPASIENMAYPLPEKPSIAVLAFDNMSNDPEKEYFSDGISEEIISALSKTDQLFVIARNSSFTYKGKPVNVKQVAEELGVRYVLEGSIRKSENRIRVTAQLIDATTGHHVWSERYDRDLEDIFALQDDITLKIITALQVELTEGEQMRMWAKRYKRLDVLLKGMEIGSLAQKGAFDSTRWGQLAQEIVDMAPELPVGYRQLAVYHSNLADYGRSPQENLEKAYRFATKAISLNESDGFSHALLGKVYRAMRQHEKAIAAGKRAIELDPNGAEVIMHMGTTLHYTGRQDEAIEHFNRAIRLNPIPPFYYYNRIGTCYWFKGNYKKALTELKKAIQLAPMNPTIHGRIAVVYSFLGREEESRESLEKALELYPNISVSLAAKAYPYKNQTDLELFLNGMRKAGFPDPPGKEPPETPSIAVLPFLNMSNDPEQEYFSDGMTDELIGDLAKIKDIFVISRNSAFTYKGKSIKVQEIAKDLNVRYILEGSVQRSGKQVRIRAQLIDGKTDHHLWSESYDGVMDDIFDLQDKITGKIVSALAIKLTPDEKDKISEKGTDNLLAYDAYLKGFEHYSLMTGENLLKAVEYYQQAIEIDPNFSRAYTALAATYWMMTFFDFPRQLGLRPFESSALRVKARHFLEIAMKNPNYETYRLAAWFDVFRRKYDSALANAEKAVSLAPNSNIVHGVLSLILNFIGRHDEALAHVDKALKLDPKFTDIFLGEKGKTYYLLGDYEKAVELIERSLKLNPGLSNNATYAAASYAFLGQQNNAERAWKIYKVHHAPTTKTLYWGRPFKDNKVFDRFVEGLVKAGFNGDPSDYYIVYKDSKLSGDQIKNQLYGKTLNGYHASGIRYTLRFDTGGEVEISFPQSGFSDKAKSFVENDQLCFEFEKLNEGIKSCSDFYNNPVGTRNNNHFIVLDDTGMYFLSIQE